MNNPVIPFDQRDGFIWYNGEIIPWQDAKIHILTHGLHYGSSVFEGERVYNGKVFKLHEHSERLIKSASMLDFALPYTAEQLDEATIAIIKKQGITDGYVRPVAWKGSEALTVSAKANSVHVAIACWTWPNYFKDIDNGITATFAKWSRPAPNTAPTASKAAGLYMIATMSKQAAEEKGAQEAIMLDYRGYLAEGTSANMFLVMNGELHTPTPDCFLNGITRQTVIELAKQAGIKVVERHIKPEELANAQEVFLTGTAAEITPVGNIDNYKFTVGAVTRDLMKRYSELVRK